MTKPFFASSFDIRASSLQSSLRRLPMHHYTLWHALIGGILIGLASLFATVLSGKIPGISGLFGRLLVAAKPHSHSQHYDETDKIWRAVFLFGLIGGATLSF